MTQFSILDVTAELKPIIEGAWPEMVPETKRIFSGWQIARTNWANAMEDYAKNGSSALINYPCCFVNFGAATAEMGYAMDSQLADYPIEIGYIARSQDFPGEVQLEMAIAPKLEALAAALLGASLTTFQIKDKAFPSFEFDRFGPANSESAQTLQNLYVGVLTITAVTGLVPA